jgi:hypothetical protein
MSLDDAVGKCEAWRRDYNEVQPHTAIGNKPPIPVSGTWPAAAGSSWMTASQAVQVLGAGQTKPEL